MVRVADWKFSNEALASQYTLDFNKLGPSWRVVDAYIRYTASALSESAMGKTGATISFGWRRAGREAPGPAIEARSGTPAAKRWLWMATPLSVA